MHDEGKSPQGYKFDDVVIDCREFRVFKRDEPRRITPRAYEVLLFLLTHEGRVVSKQELFDQIWKESFVTDNALTRMIKEIRQVIGDDADAPRYIETLPKRGYRFIAPVERIEPKTQGSAAGGENGIASIAVLPFINQSDNAENDYLSEGITESITNNLSRFPNLRVTPRSIVSYFQKQDVNPVEAGRRLNVQMVLSGRVLQRADALIVNSELVDIANESQTWGEQYRYKIRDIFDLQEEISQTISTQLQLKFGGGQQALPAVRATPDAEAYRLYLKGRYFWNRRPQGLAKGVEYFEQALNKDANFALAYAGLADSYSTLGSWENGGLPPSIAMPKARSAAMKALEIDPSLAEAHTTLAYTKLHYDWNFKEAETGVKHALALHKNYVHAHHWLSHIYMAQGDAANSLAASLRAYELEPLDLIINVHLAWHYWLARQPDEAITLAERTRELDPNVIWSSYFAGLALAQKGLYEEAAAEFRRAHALSPEVTLVHAALGNALGYCGETREARKILLELEKQRSAKFVPAYDIALVRLSLGENAAALDWLREAITERSSWCAYLRVEPRLDPLRTMPEFNELLERVGLH
jgi:DNA-binding winged helix-turn-helix (wHTH) protein/tetratricopeptide (TPR) repeat protein